MSQLTLRGVTVEDVYCYCSNEGKRTVEITCRAAWSDTVCDELAIVKEPSGFGNGSLKVQLAAVSMILEPNSKPLKDYRADMSISKMDKLRHIAKTEEGDVVTRQMEFVVTTIAEDAMLVMDKWLTFVGPSDSTAQCKITYNAKQQLELVEPDATTDVPAGEDKPRGRKRNVAEAVQ